MRMIEKGISRANLQISSSIKIHPQRCPGYWRQYYQLLEKSHELVESAKYLNGKESQIVKEIEIIIMEMNQHWRRCEQCRAWLSSF